MCSYMDLNILVYYCSSLILMVLCGFCDVHLGPMWSYGVLWGSYGVLYGLMWSFFSKMTKSKIFCLAKNNLLHNCSSYEKITF